MENNDSENISPWPIARAVLAGYVLGFMLYSPGGLSSCRYTRSAELYGGPQSVGGRISGPCQLEKRVVERREQPR